MYPWIDTNFITTVTVVSAKEKLETLLSYCLSYVFNIVFNI
jgi:hypothetical protein